MTAQKLGGTLGTATSKLHAHMQGCVFTSCVHSTAVCACSTPACDICMRYQKRLHCAEETLAELCHPPQCKHSKCPVRAQQSAPTCASTALSSSEFLQPLQGEAAKQLGGMLATKLCCTGPNTSRMTCTRAHAAKKHVYNTSMQQLNVSSKNPTHVKHIVLGSMQMCHPAPQHLQQAVGC
jgi:hypothetical protein